MEVIYNRHPDLEDVLSMRTVAELKELAKGFYVKGTSRMNKAALTDAVILALEEPERLAELLYIIDAPTYALFRRASESPEPIHIKAMRSKQHAVLTALCYMVCEELPDGIRISVPNQVRTAFEHLKADGFIKRKARFDLLHNYAMATTHLYGAISQDDFVAIFNAQNSHRTTVEELFPALIRHIAVEAPYCFWDEYIVCEEFEENDFVDVKDLLRECGDKPRYIPDKKELLRYADWDYYESTPQTDALKQFLAGKKQALASVEEVVDEIHYACIVDAGTQQIFDILDEFHITLEEHELNKFASIITAVHNNTRLWANKGHTPNELFSIYGKPALRVMNKTVSQKKIGRNEPCPCGSGKKYKKCCGR